MKQSPMVVSWESGKKNPGKGVLLKKNQNSLTYQMYFTNTHFTADALCTVDIVVLLLWHI